MVTAFVLLDVRRDRINEVAQELADIDGIAEVYSVSGRHDLIAIIRARTNEDLAEVVTRRMAHVQGIESTETFTAFRVHSRHDLETMFSIGLD